MVASDLLPCMDLVAAAAADDSNATPGQRHRTKKYNELIKSFGPLASDLPKMPAIANILLGLVECAKQIIQETPNRKMQTKMLELTDQATSMTEGVITGGVDPSKACQELENDLNNDEANTLERVSVSDLPRKRAHKALAGGITMKQLKTIFV